MIPLDEYLKQARFLIVDDEPLNVLLLEQNLEMDGQLNFCSTTDSRQALRLFREFQPDIVLLDLMMPFLDGFAVLEQLRGEIAPDENLPIVILTADISLETRQRALAAGARDFITKPLDDCELRLRIRNLLETRFLHLGLHRQNQSLDALVKERTRELEESQRQAIQQERLHAFSEMAGGVVHDFNNVLMLVYCYTELLRGMSLEKEPVEAQEYLGIIFTATQDAMQIVERLRHFYRPRHVDDLFLPTDLQQLTMQVVQLSKPRWKEQARANGREIDVKLDVPKVALALCNPSEVREVMLNLIFNAVDAMVGGGVLTLRVGAGEGAVFFEVGDTGIGMTEEVRQRCLEPFFSTKGEKGTGLGLAMVAGIIRRHEGKLEISSEAGKGTVFRVSLPECHHPAQEQAAIANGPAIRPLRILLAEDKEELSKVMALQLTTDGHFVEQVRDGAEALGKLRSAPYDLLLTDLSMPRMNGAALAAAAREMDLQLPIIMLTGFGAMLLQDGETPAGVNLLIGKPITHQKLSAAIARVAA